MESLINTIEFKRKEKEVKLVKNYYDLKDKKLEDLKSLEEKLKLLKDTSEFHKENKNDKDMSDARDVVLQMSLDCFKEIKKDDEEITIAGDKIYNSLRELRVIVDRKQYVNNDTLDSLSEFHESVDELVSRVIVMATPEIKEEMLMKLESKNLTKSLIPKLRNK